MSMLTVRDLDPQVKAKLRERAARRGHSMEAEVRQILTDAVAKPDDPTDLALSIRKHFAGTEIQLEFPDRESAGQRPVEFRQ